MASTILSYAILGPPRTGSLLRKNVKQTDFLSYFSYILFKTHFVQFMFIENIGEAAMLKMCSYLDNVFVIML